MDSHQKRLLNIFSSFMVSLMAFCVTLLVMLLVGGILLGRLENDTFIPSQLVVLFVVSILVGLVVAVWAGRKYYRHVERE